ncbi:hypothetical protein P691DRAFT_813574 [Macrolepiota fuliginosa MF-IS2]|uniref:Uncharacterized protein n=1 Tax=Macrolepiota fuliginosa MF-IS2 TaxID=1400762 RepID=A0A9P6BWW9_9AGAR|nr:hypothetical protein P691DRAFT_813574 [Macrolepiota fuliginosa MF-IS2]
MPSLKNGVSSNFERTRCKPLPKLATVEQGQSLEATETLLTTKDLLILSALPKGKVKREETKCRLTGLLVKIQGTGVNLTGMQGGRGRDSWSGFGNRRRKGS